MIPNMTIGDPKDGDNMTFHNFVAGSGGRMSNDNGTPYKYQATKMATNNPLVNARGEAALEAYSMFGLDSLHRNDYITEGHFWPMAFKYHENETSYFTTMNIFRHEEGDDIVDGDGSGYWANYFRVGPQGPEANQLFFYNGFRDEYSTAKPGPDRSKSMGYVGTRSLTRWGDTGWANGDSEMMAVGLTSWRGYHVVVKSDADYYGYARDAYRMYGCAREGPDVDDPGTTWYDDIDNFGAFMTIGDYQQFGTGNNTVTSYWVVNDPGVMSLGVREGTNGAEAGIPRHDMIEFFGGLEINPLKIEASDFGGASGTAGYNDGNHGGVFLYTRDKNGSGSNGDIHIVRYTGN